MPCELNGEPGVLMHVALGWAAMTVTVTDGLVTAVNLVTNPAKLEHLVAALVPDRAGRPGPWDAAVRFRHRRGERIT